MNSIELQQRPQDVPHVPEQLLIAAEATQPAHDVLAEAQVHSDHQVTEARDAQLRANQARESAAEAHDEDTVSHDEPSAPEAQDQEEGSDQKEDEVKVSLWHRAGAAYTVGLMGLGNAAARVSAAADRHPLLKKAGIAAGLTVVAGAFAGSIAARLSGGSTETGHVVANMMDMTSSQGGASHDTVGQVARDVVANHNGYSAGGQNYDVQHVSYSSNLAPEPGSGGGAGGLSPEEQIRANAAKVQGQIDAAGTGANQAPTPALQLGEVKKGEGLLEYLKDAGMTSAEERAAVWKNPDLMKIWVDNKDAYGQDFGLKAGALDPKSAQALEAFHQDWMTKNPNGVVNAANVNLAANGSEVVVSNGMGRVNVELPDGFKSSVDKNGVLHVVTPDNKDIAVTLPKDAIDAKTGELTPKAQAVIKDTLKANGLEVTVTGRKTEVKLLSSSLVEHPKKGSADMAIEYKAGPHSKGLLIQEKNGGIVIDATGTTVKGANGAADIPSTDISITDANGKTMLLEGNKIFVAKDSPVGKMLADGRHVDVRAGVLDEANNKFVSHATAVSNAQEVEFGPNYELIAGSTDVDELAGVDTTVTVKVDPNAGAGTGSNPKPGTTGAGKNIPDGGQTGGTDKKVTPTTSSAAPTTTTTSPAPTTTTKAPVTTTTGVAPTTTETTTTTTPPTTTSAETSTTTSSKAAAVPTTTEAPAPTTTETTTTTGVAPTTTETTTTTTPPTTTSTEAAINNANGETEGQGGNNAALLIAGSGIVLATGVAGTTYAVKTHNRAKELKQFVKGRDEVDTNARFQFLKANDGFLVAPKAEGKYDPEDINDIFAAQQIVDQFEASIPKESPEARRKAYGALGLLDKKNQIPKGLDPANRDAATYTRVASAIYHRYGDMTSARNFLKDAGVNGLLNKVTNDTTLVDPQSLVNRQKLAALFADNLGLTTVSEANEDREIYGKNSLWELTEKRLRDLGITPEMLTYEFNYSTKEWQLTTNRSLDLLRRTKELARVSNRLLGATPQNSPVPQPVPAQQVPQRPVAQPRPQPLQAPQNPFRESNWSNPPQAQGQVPSTPLRPQPRPEAVSMPRPTAEPETRTTPPVSVDGLLAPDDDDEDES